MCLGLEKVHAGDVNEEIKGAMAYLLNGGRKKIVSDSQLP